MKVNVLLRGGLLLTLTVFFCVNESKGQGEKTGTLVKALILDSYAHPLPYANFMAYTAVDSTLVQGAASDMEGKVVMRLAPGNYLFKVGFLAFKDQWRGPVLLLSSTLELGEILLDEDMEQLQTVEIVSDKSQMELQIDKRVINVQQDLSNRGKNAAEILDNVPSVSVSVEGDVSLRGSENVRILVNGKPSGLTGISGNSALRQLQGDMIESIEIITNPSAKYEAQGEVGIINIILKKDQRSGVNGAIDLTAGFPSLYGASGNLNWRKDKWNLFTSMGYRFQENPGFGKINQRFETADTSYSFKNERNHIRGGSSVNARLGADWNIDDHWTLTISGLISKAKGNNSMALKYFDFNQAGDNTRYSLRTEEESEDTDNLEFDVNLIKTFAEKDHIWTFDIKSNRTTDTEEASIEQDFGTEGIGVLRQRSENAENEHNLVVQTDYVHPLSESKKLEFGLRSGSRSIKNTFQVEQFEGDWIFLPAFTNELRYEEWISAGYATYTSEKNKWAYQLGLRAEYSDIQTELLLTQEKNPRDYLNFFPSAFLTFKCSSSNSYQLNYSRRINRPRFRFLIPFYGYGDSRNFYGGNPDLNPEYSHNIEFNRLTRTQKGSIIFGLYSRLEEGSITRITQAADTGTYTFPINLGNGYSLGSEFSGNMEVIGPWKISGSVNVYYNVQEGVFEGIDYGFETWAWNSRISNKLVFKNLFDFQANVIHRSGQISVQGSTKPITSLDLAASRDIFKGKGTLTFNVNDVFNSRKRRSIVEQPGYYSENEFQWRSRLFSLNFNYRINQKKFRKERGYDMDDSDFGS